MKVTELPEEVQSSISHIKNWQTLISEDAATILDKLSKGEELSRAENNLEVTPSELAAIWSITNKLPVEVRYVREVKRDGRIEASKTWGSGPGARSLYRVKAVRDIKITQSAGRPKGSRNRKKEAA